MLEWFSSFGNFIVILINFLIAFFKNVVEIVTLIFKGFVYLTQIIVFLPVQYQAVLLALISFSVIVTVIHFGG